MADINPEVLKVQLAEQALRESLSARAELRLLEVDLLNFPRGAFIMATVQGTRALIPMEIEALLAVAGRTPVRAGLRRWSEDEGLAGGRGFQRRLR